MIFDCTKVASCNQYWHVISLFSILLTQDSFLLIHVLVCDFCILIIQGGVLLILIVTAIINISFIMDTHEKKKVNKGEDFAFQLFFNKSLFNHFNKALYY